MKRIPVAAFAVVVAAIATSSASPSEGSSTGGTSPPSLPAITPCDPGLHLEPHAYTATIYQQTHVYANVATTTPFSSSPSDYYEAYLRFSDNSGNYIQIHVTRSPGDQGVMKVWGRYHDSSGTYDNKYDNFTTAPNLELRYNPLSGMWEAYDGIQVLQSGFLNFSGGQTREYGVTVYPQTTYCPTVSATFTSTDPAASGLTYVDDDNYHAVQVSSTSLKVSGPS